MENRGTGKEVQRGVRYIIKIEEGGVKTEEEKGLENIGAEGEATKEEAAVDS